MDLLIGCYTAHQHRKATSSTNCCYTEMITILYNKNADISVYVELLTDRLISQQHTKATMQWQWTMLKLVWVRHKFVYNVDSCLSCKQLRLWVTNNWQIAI